MESEINTQEEKRDESDVGEEDDDDDGPPPGFQRISSPQPPRRMSAAVDEEEEEEDRPPPGFHFIAPKPSTPLLTSDIESSKQKDHEDEEDGPPPGWEFFSLTNVISKQRLVASDVNVEISDELNEGENEVDDEGPPPGWETVLQHQTLPTCAQPLLPLSSVSSDTEIGSKQGTARNIDNATQSVPQSTLFPSVLQSIPLPVQSLPPTPQMQQLSSSASPGEDIKDGCSKARPPQALSPNKLLPAALHSLTSNIVSSSSEKAQLVCGTCQKLCLYLRGAKWVQCPGCQEVNFVLEAHEVGQVKCGNCAVLLMYPFGAPAVHCTSCRSVTEIGASNWRPPLSVQQEQAQARARAPGRGRRRPIRVPAR